MRNPGSPTGYSAGLPMNRFVHGCGNLGMNFVSHDVSRHYGAYCRVDHGEISLQICNSIEFFRNSPLMSRIKQEKITKTFRDSTRD